MKQKLPLFIALLLLATACKKGTTEQFDVRKEATSGLSGMIQPMSAGDGQNDLLGYGYDVTGEYASSGSSKFSVIDVAQLKIDHPTRVEWDLSSTTYGILNAGESAVSYLEKITGRVSSTLTLTKPVFKGTITASFSDSTAFSSNYVYSSYDLIIKRKRVKFNANTTLLKSYLTASFSNDIQNQTAQYIVNAYGTHILSDIILGAKFQALYRAETTNTDRKKASEAGVDVGVKSIFTINTGYTYTSTHTNQNTSQVLKYKTIGGDPSISVIGTIPIGPSLPTISISAWQASSTVANAELIDIASSGLIPIYELIDDPVKKLAVQQYVNQYLLDNQAQLLPAPVYEFYCNPCFKHALDMNPNFHLPYAGWAPNDQPFKAYPFAYNFAVPIYEFVHTSNDHLYADAFSASGWQRKGIKFYAYLSQTSGTVPVYEFWHQAGKNHFYSRNVNANASFPGWVNTGVAFYAFPN